jgi:nucleotide-binding universal stress UspA family protein
MAFRKIMCPVDRSESSTVALDNATTLAAAFGARLLIVHVNECRLVSSQATSAKSDVALRARLRLSPRAEGLSVEHFVLSGDAADQIPKFAQSHNVDLVVMGREEVDHPFHIRFDGVSHAATIRCSCPVMTCSSHKDVPAVQCS